MPTAARGGFLFVGLDARRQGPGRSGLAGPPNGLSLSTRSLPPAPAAAPRCFRRFICQRGFEGGERGPLSPCQRLPYGWGFVI